MILECLRRLHAQLASVQWDSRPVAFVFPPWGLSRWA
jgi:hypothetical protein